MRDFVNADCVTLPASWTGGEASQQREFFISGNRACSSRVEPAAESVEPAARRAKSPVGCMHVSKRVDSREIETWWECYTQLIEKTKAGTR